MTTKRRRAYTAKEPVRCKRTRRLLQDEEMEAQQQLPEYMAGRGFFESPAVRAWYSGATEALPNLSVESVRASFSLIPTSLPSVMDSAEAPVSQPCDANCVTDDGSASFSASPVLPTRFVDYMASRGDHVYSEAELETIDGGFELLVPSPERLADIKADAITSMSPASEELQPCCICELSCEKSDIVDKHLTDEFVQRMKECISMPVNVPAAISAQYNASNIDLRLKGIILFPPAIRKNDNSVYCQVCKTCNECITGGKTPSLPVNAIANGNYIGWLPSRFRAMTRTDEQAVALVLPCVSLSVVTGGPCRTIKSHHYVVRNTEGPITEMLPRDLSNRVRVTMVGHMTNDQVVACKRRYRLNLSLCRKFLNFLYINNRLYIKHQRAAAVVRPGVSHTQAIVGSTGGAQSTTSRAIVHDNNIGDEACEHSPPRSSCNPDGFIVNHTTATGEMYTINVAQNVRDQSTYSTFGSTIDEGSDVAIENVWIAASSVLQSPPTQDFVDVVVRKSNDYMATAKWATCLQMFPTLFPAGCGGPTEARKKHLSVRQWILRSLRLHGHRFEKHYAFMLLAFDYLATESARRTLFIKMNVKQQALRAAEVKRSTVVEALKYFEYLSQCKAKGMKPRPPIEEVQRVIDLRKGIRVPESAFYGSNIGRMRARFDLFGMLKRFGPLQLFFTISPDTSGTYNIALKSGEASNKLIEDANILLMPTRAERKQIAASYPVECARYFLRVIDTVIEVFLGWDRKLNAPKKGGGIFGIVRAFGASAETQVAGDLHAHFAIWLHGFPRTSLELYRALTGESEFKRRLVQLVDSTLSSKPPTLVSEDTCVRCHEEGYLQTVIPGVDAYRRPVAGASPPTTALCSACGATFRDKDIIDSSLLEFGVGHCDATNLQWKDFEKCRAPRHGVDDAVATSLLVRDVQVHYWNHCKSCFKKTVRTPKGTICRFLKPENVHLGNTLIDDNQLLRIHRPIGCEYVNAYNPTVMNTMKCNHDAQFVLSDGSRATAAYVVKYCFKAQNPVENQVSLSLAAFTKAVAKTNVLPADTSPMERGYKILGSMLYTVTNGQEVAAPMAALYILNGTPFWFSHEFVRVDLWKMIQKESGSVEISVSQEQVQDQLPTQDYISSETALERYWKRSDELNNVSFIDILERFEYVRTKTVLTPRGSTNSERGSFVRLGPPKVLVVCGKEIPDISSHLEHDIRNFYYLALLTLFKPHRRSTLITENQSPTGGYRSFLSNGDSREISRMQEFELQWQDYYQAQRSSDANEESPEEQLLRTRAPATDASVNDATVQNVPSRDDDLNVPDDFTESTASTAPERSTQKLSDDATATIQGVLNLENTIIAVEQSFKNSHDGVNVDADFDVQMYTSLLVASNPSADPNECLGTHAFIAQFKEALTRLELLQECFAPVPYRALDGQPRWSPTTLPQFPQIAMVSEAFRLNFWQHVVFEVAARHLLFAYSQDIDGALSEPLLPPQTQCQPYDIKNQLIGYIGGEAGTGKSTVVDALLTFANKWGRAGSVETLAFTGVASINIKGRTMHSARNLKLNGAEPNAPPTLEMKSRFSGVVLVIIDEISITDQGLLGGTDAVSRSMSLTPGKFMGGKHTLLIGDLLQLPPVAGSPCFQPPPPHAARQRQAGYALYSAINFVAFLTKNMRARFDPEYTKILDDLRWGRLSDVQLEILNTRVQVPEPQEEPSTVPQHELSYRPIVVSRELSIYECLAQPSFRSKTVVEHLSNANDNLTDRIPMKLLFYVGMPVMITHKHPDLLDADVIANGVIGTLVGTYPSLEELPEIVYEVSGTVIHKLLRLPALLLIKLLGVETTLVRGFPKGVIGLPPLKASVHLGRIPNLSQSSVTVTQFALVPAFACTTEKLQGQTCYDGIVVTPLDRRRGVPCQTLYVALSRAVSLDGLTLTEPITRVYLEQFKPTEPIATEMQRLIDLVVPPPYISVEETHAFSVWKSTQHV